MENSPTAPISQLLRAWAAGDAAALDGLIEIAYPELHRIAQRCLNNERPGHTIQATALVNEAYVKLAELNRIDWQNRAHFFAVGARIMRRILVDYARARASAKHGGAGPRVDFTESLVVSPNMDPNLAALDDALRELEKLDARKCQIVEMRYFGGLTAEEIALV